MVSLRSLFVLFFLLVPSVCFAADTAINAQTETTTGADGDIFPFYDLDLAAGRGMTFSNFWSNYLKGKADALYQPLDADLTTYAGITPSANVQSLLGAADYAAIRVLLNFEDGADVTDATNVAAAGALMDSGTDNIDDTHINWGSGAGQVDMSDFPASGSWSPTGTLDFSGATVTFGLADSDVPTTLTLETISGSPVITNGVAIGTDDTNHLIDEASNGAGSTTLYIGNESILASGDIGVSVQGYNADTTILGATIGAAEVDADVATQAELDTVQGLYDTDDELIAIINASPSTQIGVPAGGTGAATFTDGGLLVGAGTGAFEPLAVGLTTQVLVGGGAGTNPAWGTDLPTAVTIGSGYIYRAGGTDVPDADVADDITLTNITQITNRAITSLSATNWRLFYSADGGVPVELALGASGTYLKSNGAAAAPTFDTPAGSGDMTQAVYDIGANSKVDDADAVTASDSGDAAATWYPTIVDGATGTQAVQTDAGLTFNPSTNTLTAGVVAGTSVTTGTQAITDNAILTVDSASAASGETARFTANGLESRSDAEMKTQLGYMTDLADDTTPTLGAELEVGEVGVRLDETLSADGTWSGTVINGVIGYTNAFGDLVYLATADQRWEQADASAEATAGDVMLAIALTTGTDGSTVKLLLQGFVREDDWNFTSYGQALYVSTTAGGMTQTAPSATTEIVRVVGYAHDDADTIYFNPAGSWVEIQ